MRTNKAFLVFFILAGQLLYGGEDVSALRVRAIAELRAAQKDPSKLVGAAKILTQVVEAYEKAGDDAACSEMSACLYWAKKRMTRADATAFVKIDSVAAAKAESVVARKVKKSDATEWLKRADDFAKTVDDHLLVSIRYFEVADRFRGTDSGIEAMGKSLEAMRKAGLVLERKEKTPKPKPEAVTGRVYVRSEPSGATILLKEEGLREIGKTPRLVPLVARALPYALVLQKNGYRTKEVMVKVSGAGISKPGIAKLERNTVAIDVLFQDGWQVFVDKKPIRDTEDNIAKTPCTINLVLGMHEFGFARNGFMDILQRVKIEKNGQTVDLSKKRTRRGKSQFLGKPTIIRRKNPTQPKTEKEWLLLPGKVYTVKATYNAAFPMKLGLIIPRGRKIFIAAHPNDKWGGGGSRAGILCNYHGYPRRSPWMKMFIRVGTKARPVDDGIFTSDETAQLELYAIDDKPQGNPGEIRVKVILQRD